jgi:hypothetical protein
MAGDIEIRAEFAGEKRNSRDELIRKGDWGVARARIVESIDERLKVGEVYDFTGVFSPYEAKIDDAGQVKQIGGDFIQGLEYRFKGRVKIDSYVDRRRVKRTSTQFEFSTFNKCEPVTKKAVCVYLQQADYIGPKIALAIWNEFGPDAVRTLRESPEKVAACQSIKLTIKQAQDAATYFQRFAALEHCTMEVTGLLDGQGLPRSTPKKAIKQWGNCAASIIRKNPYQLMRFRGIGFNKADKLYTNFELPLGRMKRQTLAIWAELHKPSVKLKFDTEETDPKRREIKAAAGHTWFPWNFAERALREKVGSVFKLDCERAVAIGERAGLLATCIDESGRRWIAEGVKARSEEKLADLVVSAMDEANPWSKIVEHPAFNSACDRLTDHQRAGLRRALAGGAVAILGGGPGAGKTFVAAAIMRALVAIYGEGAIAATAFTGKAASRFNEGMQEYGLPIRAKTTHSLLRLSIGSDDDEDEDVDDDLDLEVSSPSKSAGLPGVQIIVVDEVSMDDVPLMVEIAKARARGSAILIIGDEKQLPPIGHGAPLRDLIRAGLPYGELTEIRRNAGAVVRFCKKLREGEPIAISDFVHQASAVNPIGDDPANLRLITAHKPADAISAMLAAIHDASKRFNFDPVWETQVVVSRNNSGELTRVPLNEVLQREFNTDAAPIPNCKFRVGSKAIQLKNTTYDRAEYDGGASNNYSRKNDSCKVFNGEFFRIVDVDEKRIVAEFSTPSRTVWIPQRRPKTSIEGGDGEEKLANQDVEPKAAFDLGYAATCHKMQGSQEKHVVVVLEKDNGGPFTPSLEWLLTAVSRCEKLCTVIGDISTIRKMERKTFLVERIEEKRIWSSRCWWLVDEETTVEGAVRG